MERKKIAKMIKLATEPSRELDAIIAVHFDWRFDDHEEGDLTARGMAEKHGIEWLIDRIKNSSTTIWRHIPTFTKSIDDVMSLVGKVMRCEFGIIENDSDCWAYLHFERNGDELNGNSEGLANTPMALLSAYIDALEQEQ